jgi:hypothetical protein
MLRLTLHFISIHHEEISKQVSVKALTEVNTSFYMLRDDNIAGILAGFKEQDGTFTIFVDFVPSKYRDYKLGDYYFNQHPEFLKEQGIKRLKTHATEKEHCLYLQKMGFVCEDANDKTLYQKRL